MRANGRGISGLNGGDRVRLDDLAGDFPTAVADKDAWVRKTRREQREAEARSLWGEIGDMSGLSDTQLDGIISMGMRMAARDRTRRVRRRR